MKIVFLASGNGGNLKFFHQALKNNIIQHIKISVIADRDCGSLDYCLNNKIDSKKIKYNQKNNKELLDALKIMQPDIIITNWHKIIDSDIVEKYAGKMINLHYSLLPAFGGLIGVKPILMAYEQGCGYVGATCHYVNKKVDTGSIILQAIVKADVDINVACNKVFRKGCLILLNSIVLNSKDMIIEKTQSNQLDFSPSLQFNPNIFKDNFWLELSEL